MNKMQEKFQITPKPENDEPHLNQWANFNDQRVISSVKDTTDDVEFWAFDPSSPHTYQLSHNNEMPPGYHIDHQHGHGNRFEGFKKEIYLAGTQDETDNPKGRDLINGFVLAKMSPVEDMYSEEHKDDFYDSVKLKTAEGEVEGFVERANYLDRA